MKLSHALTLTGVGGLGLGAMALIVSACSSSSSGGTAGGGTSVGAAPQPPNAPATTVTAEHNFALYSLLLGDTDRSGVSSPSAWKNYGYNLDGKVTTKDSTDVCTQAAGASKTQQADGTNGIDNSFGANILQIILSTAGNDAAKKINDSIQQGKFTVMIDTTGLDDADPKQTATELKGKLYAGGAFPTGMTPTFTMSDDWPVRPELLTDKSNVSSASIHFDHSFVTNGTYVTGSPPGQLTLSLAFGGVALDLEVDSAVITFDHTGAGKADNGTIAGVINTQKLIDGLQKVAGRISTSLCSGSAFASIAAEIKQASDIMSNGTNTAGAACDAISIGLGFTAKEIGKPKSIATLGTPAPDPCAAGDGGTGGGDSGGGSSDASTD